MKSKRVLIVDDNDLNRKLFENLVGQLFSYESAKNGIEAVELAEKSIFDLILMDIQMPKMDGISAMRKIRQGINSACPILAVTAYAEESERDSFIEQGFDEFITKPIRPKEFLHLVQGYLNGNQVTPSPSDEDENTHLVILDKKIIEQLLKYNSKTVIRKVFDEFIMECEETEAMIKNQNSENRNLELIEKIHAMKGNSGTLGAMQIYNSATKAEEFGRKEDFVHFDQEIKNLRNEIIQFREFLKQQTIFEL